MAGTFIIRAGLVTLNNGGANAWTDHTGGTSLLAHDAWSLATGGDGNQDFSGFFSSTPGPNNATLRFSGDTVAIYVDGAPVSFAGLPSGFTPTSALLTAVINGNATYFLQFDPFTEDAGHFSLSGTHTFTFPFPLASIPAILNLVNDGFGIRKSILGGEGFSQLLSLEISGSYIIVSNPFTPPTPPVPSIQNSTIPVRVGDKVKIISDELHNLDQVEKIELGIDGIIVTLFVYDSYFILLVSEDEIWFDVPLPIGTHRGLMTVTLVFFPGTQFSGSVLAGTLSVLYEDASGIYKLVRNKTNDTLYFREGSTTDINQLFLPSLLEDNTLIEDDFFSMLAYPYKILSQTINNDEEEEDNNFLITAKLRIPVVLEDVNIPSPFIKTSFLP